MKIIIINNTILSLENVRRVDKYESHNKKEMHGITITYCDNEEEHCYFNYDDSAYLNNIFESIAIKLSED